MKVLSKAFYAVFILAVIFLVFLAFGSVNNRWYRVVTIEGDSMSPTLWIGDMIVVTPPSQAVPINTIVVMNIAGSLVTHRLVGFDAIWSVPSQKGMPTRWSIISLTRTCRSLGFSGFACPVLRIHLYLSAIS